MKRITHIIAGIIAAGAVFAACTPKEENVEASAVLPSEDYLSFAAVSAPGAVIQVFADGDWASDVSEDWVTVDPATGSGNTEITISVADNKEGSAIGLPRDAKVIFRGSSVERQGTVNIHQEGDTYKGVQELTVTEVLALEDEAVAKIPSATVAAITTAGFVATDGTSLIYVQGAKQVKVGDSVSMSGAKATFNNCPSFIVDGLEVLSNTAFTYPEATDLTASLADYDGKSVVFGKLGGSIVNGALKVGTSATVQILDPIASLGLGELDLHKVVITGYAVGKAGTTGYMVVTAVEDNGKDETLIPYPLWWAIGKDVNYSSDTFNNEHPRVDPVQGIGYIEYVPFDLENTNAAGNYKLDVNAYNPRVTGPWVNDYWLFYGNGAVPAGTEVQIAFEMRSSKWGQKFWLLEYLDGEEWKVAGTPQLSTEPGYEVQYTCATNIDGATNIPVMENITFRRNNEHMQIRLRCSANWRGGGGTTEARSTASSRLSITNMDDDTYRPHIIIVKEGNGIEKDPVYANIEVSTDLITFNGIAGEPKKFNVKSDYDWRIVTAGDWFSLDVTEGLAGEETEVTITCQDSELAELREGSIKIYSEESVTDIHVVQGAAGQLLDPFISLSSGNRIAVSEEEGSKEVTVQSNIDFETEVSDTWLTLTPVDTKAMVDWKSYNLAYTANESTEERTATVRFYNTEKNLESILTVTQAGKPVVLENLHVQWTFGADLMAAYKDQFETDNAFKANTDGLGTLSWIDLEANVTADVNNAKKRVIGGTGEPYISGAFPGDGWLFTIPLYNVPAGYEVTFKGTHKASKTGHRFWKMECSLDGGTTWTPVGELKTEDVTGTSASYTHELPSDAAVPVDEVIALPAAVAEGELLIRFCAAANWQVNGKGALAAPNGGTHRWTGGGVEITIAPGAEPPAPVVVFEDDFNWFKDIADAANAGDGVGDQKSDANAPNVYTFDETGSAAFFALFNEKGYEDLNPTAKVMYLQKYYLKFSKGKNVGGIRLPKMEFGAEPADAVLEFDWCAQMGGSGAVDAVSLNVELTGAGTCADSGAAVSNEIAHNQETGQMFWQHVKINLKDVTNATRIEVKPKQFGATSGYYRWFIDNIKVTK